VAGPGRRVGRQHNLFSKLEPVRNALPSPREDGRLNKLVLEKELGREGCQPSRHILAGALGAEEHVYDINILKMVEQHYYYGHFLVVKPCLFLPYLCHDEKKVNHNVVRVSAGCTNTSQRLILFSSGSLSEEV